MESRNILKIGKEYLIITLGVFLYCVSWTTFIIPKGIAGGGVTGLATVIYYATNGSIPVSLSYLCINSLLVLAGTLILGKGFGFKTIYSIILASVFFKVLPELITWVSDIEEPFINALIGGAVSGLGIYLIFSVGGSTGGTDIIALVLSKYREVTPGKVFMVCDLIIIASIIFVPGKTLQDIVYGYIQMISFSYTLDLVLTGDKQSVQVLIFSRKYQEIADTLVHDLGRGVTALEAMGWYSQEESKVLVVVVKKTQLNGLTKIVKKIDNSAFLSVSQAMSVYGKGFDQIKSGGELKWKKLNKFSKKQKPTLS